LRSIKASKFPAFDEIYFLAVMAPFSGKKLMPEAQAKTYPPQRPDRWRKSK
jgi:hypothetical protein